jgi:transaldolase
MKFFLNTVYIEEVRKIKELQIIDGINTNLAGMEALGVKDINQILTHYNAICQTFNKTVLVDVKAKDYSSILREVDILTSVNELITVKIPANLDGIKAYQHIS